MKNTAIFLVLWLCALSSTAQQPTTDRAIEGAKVLVEILKLIQREKGPNPSPAPAPEEPRCALKTKLNTFSTSN